MYMGANQNVLINIYYQFSYLVNLIPFVADLTSMLETEK